MVLIYSFFTVTNTTSLYSNRFPKVNLTNHALRTPYFSQYCNIGEYSCVWSKSADVCLYLPNRPGVNKANICRNPVGKLANNWSHPSTFFCGNVEKKLWVRFGADKVSRDHASEEEDINPLFTELISDAEGKAWSVLGSLADGLREYYQRQLWI